jgi:hypothetical protein
VLWLDHGKLQAYGDVQSVMQMYLEHVADHQRANLLDEHELDVSGQSKSSRKKRWGSREVELNSIEMFNGSKTPCYLYKTGDKMAIEILYKD